MCSVPVQTFHLRLSPCSPDVGASQDRWGQGSYDLYFWWDDSCSPAHCSWGRLRQMWAPAFWCDETHGKQDSQLGTVAVTIRQSRSMSWSWVQRFLTVSYPFLIHEDDVLGQFYFFWLFLEVHRVQCARLPWAPGNCSSWISVAEILSQEISDVLFLDFLFCTIRLSRI